MPKIDIESWPKFPGDPGIQILAKNPVLSANNYPETLDLYSGVVAVG